MNWWLLVTCLCASALVSLAQTNASASLGEEFDLPPIQLRADGSADLRSAVSQSSALPAEESTAAPPPDTCSPASAPDSAATRTNPPTADFHVALHAYGIRDDTFYLEKLDRTPVTFLDKVFQPEVIHIGRKELSCSVITAVKRKNPLCLLNPVFFNLSW